MIVAVVLDESDFVVSDTSGRRRLVEWTAVFFSDCASTEAVGLLATILHDTQARVIDQRMRIGIDRVQIRSK